MSALYPYEIAQKKGICTRPDCDNESVGRARHCSLECFDAGSYYDVYAYAEQIRELAEAGNDITTISHNIDRSTSWISYIVDLTDMNVRKHQHQHQQRTDVSDDLEEIIIAYRMGMSFEKMSEKFGYGTTVLYRVLTENGEHTRGESRKGDVLLYRVCEKSGKLDELREKVISEMDSDE